MRASNSTLPERETNHRTTAGGFTLGEVLVVMLIISILLVLIVPRLGQGSSLSTSIALMEASFNEARARAMGEGKRARVVIYNDRADKEYEERHLRYIAIAVEETDEDGNPTGNWIADDSFGEFLSPGVFFDHEGSKKASSLVESSNPPPADATANTGFGTWREGTVDFPGPPEGEQPCFYFEFNAEGICIQEDSTAPGAAVILSRGSRPVGRDPVLQDNEKGGFIVLRNGSTSIFRDISDITK